MSTQNMIGEQLEGRLLLAAFVSDDFNATTLNGGLWSFVDPLGDSVVSVDGTNLMISLPAGSDHNLDASQNRAARVLQPTDDADFEMEVKFESVPTQKYQMQGLLVQASESEYLRFDFFHDGVGLRLFAASYSGGTMVTKANVSAVSSRGVNLFMNVARTGDSWVQKYSYDGITWYSAANFTHSIDVADVGAFAGNAAGTGSPAFTTSIDYFFNNASRIDPEDANAALDTSAPVSLSLDAENSTHLVEIGWVMNEPVTAVVEYGLTSAFELGSVSSTLLGTTGSVTLDLDPFTNYHYRVLFTNGNGLEAVSGGQLVRSGQAIQSAPAIDVWHGDNQSFGGIGSPQRWVNVLGRATDLDGIDVLLYSLNGGPERVLRAGPNPDRLGGPGDFNIELEAASLLSGSNAITLKAVDIFGSVSTRQVNISYDPQSVWPADFVADWDLVENPYQLGQVVDGLWARDGEGIRPVETGYDRLVALGDIGWSDYEITVPITINGFDSDATSAPAVGLITRWTGHHDGWLLEPRSKWWPLGALGIYRENQHRTHLYGNAGAILGSDPAKATLEIGTRYMFKMRAESYINTTTLYSLKVWEATQAEPANWTVTAHGVPGELETGSIILMAHFTDATFGDVTIESLVDTTPATVSNIDVRQTARRATIEFETSERATATLDYGLTTAYELGSVGQPLWAQSHEVQLEGLEPGTSYHFRLRVVDRAGNTTTTGDHTFTTGTGVLTSDDFNRGAIAPLPWTVHDPVGDAAVGLDGTRAILSVPAGTDHNIDKSSNRSVRLMQPTLDSDFELEVKFESLPTQKYQMEGLLIEESADRYLRFDFHSDGNDLRLFASSIANGGMSTRHNKVAVPGAGQTLYMRVGRSGDLWTHTYSYDGTTWHTAGTFSFAMSVTSSGVFAGNASGSTSPAFTAVVDYMFDTEVPVVPEDAGSDTQPPVILDVSVDPESTEAMINVLVDEGTTAVLKYGLTANYELGSVVQTQLSATHALFVSGLSPEQTYHFRLILTDGSNNTTTSGDYTFTTDSPAIHSDEFDGTGLDGAFWSFVDPVGDSSVTVTGGRAYLNVAGGSDHDLGGSYNRSARIMQSVTDDDFEVEVKFDSKPTAKYQMQGILVDVGNGDYLRFEYFSDGKGLRVYAGSVANNTLTTRYNKVAAGGSATSLYMRVRRIGNAWTQTYSYDGSTWFNAASFSYTSQVTHLGVFAGNASGTNSPAHTAAIDYFLSSAV